MANTKISALPAVTSLAAADTFPVVQSGVTKKAAVSDISNLMLTTAPQTSFRNMFINGNFIVNQRNSSGYTVVAGAALQYTVDRWYSYCTGANTTIDNSLYIGAKRRFQITGATGVTGFGFGQRVEASTTRNSSNFTLSVTLQSSTLTSVTWTAYTANSIDSFGTLASPTKTQVATGTFVVSSGGTRSSATFAASGSNGIEIVFSGGALIASQSLLVFDAQLESGSVATVFENRPMALEHSMCLRYYEKNYLYGVPAGFSTTSGIHEFYGCSNNSNVIGGYIKFAVPKRNTSYTATFYTPGGTAGSWTYLRSGVSATSVAVAASNGEYGLSFGSGSIGAAWVVATIAGFWVADNEL